MVLTQLWEHYQGKIIVFIYLNNVDMSCKIKKIMCYICRLTSLRPMTVSCINTFYDKSLQSSSFWTGLSIQLKKQWSLLKVKIFYLWINFIDTAN